MKQSCSPFNANLYLIHCLLPSSNGWLTWPHSLLAKISLRERVTNEAGGERIRAREQAPPLAYAFHNILLRIQELAITLPGGYNAWLITYINIMLRSIKTHTAALGHHWLIIGRRKFSLLSYNIAVYERWTFDHKTLQGRRECNTRTPRNWLLFSSRKAWRMNQIK